MTRGMKDLQGALAEVDLVAMLEPAGRGATGNPELGSNSLGSRLGSTDSGENSVT
jgi:hypothetical protein